MANLRLSRLLEPAAFDRPAVESLDEAAGPAPWGGAWQVWTCRSAEAADG
jgi:hypothetical protein